MKRILIITLFFLSLNSVIKADELRNSLNYHKTVLSSLAGCHSSFGNQEKAIEFGTQLLELERDVHGTEHPNYANSLDNLAKYYSRNGDYDDAVRLGTEANEIKKRITDTENLDHATLLINFADQYFANGDYNEAIRLGTEAMEIYKRVLGDEHPNYATSLNNLAKYYSVLGNNNEAIRLGTKAMEIYKRVLGTEHQYYITSLINLADYYFANGDYNEAVRLGSEAMVVSKRVLGAKHPYYALALINLADYRSELGDYNEALRLGTEAMEISKRVLGTEHPYYVSSLNNLASYYSNLGDYNEAVRLGTEAMEIYKKVMGSEHPNYATSLDNLAGYYSVLGNYNEAIRLGTEAMEIRKKVLGPEHPNYATSLDNLAVYYSSLGDYNKAVPLRTEAMEIKKRVLGPEHPDYAASLNNLADYYFSIGNYNEAIRLGTEAMEIRKKVYGTKHPDYSISLSNLAECYSILGDYNKAIRLGTEAMEIRKSVFGSEHPDCAVSLNNLALYYSAFGYYSVAIPLFVESISIIRKNVFSTFSGLTAKERSLYWNKYNFIFNSSVPDILVSSGSPDVASILYDNSALFAKGLLLSTEQEMMKLIQESGDNEALQMYSILRENRKLLNALYSKPIADRYLNCDSLESVSNNLERQLVSRIKEFGDYTRNLSITWQDVQNKLTNSEIAIEFLSYLGNDDKTKYVALTLCKSDTAPILTRLFVEPSLLNASGEDGVYHTSLADSLIWGSLSSRIEGKSQVYFSASGMLHNIGIEYLPSMEGKECYRLSSTRELVTHKPDETLRSATLYGDINYDASYASIESSTPCSIGDYAMNETNLYRGNIDYRSINNGVSSLPGTRVELNEVSALMKQLGVPIDTLTGVLASEESFKALSGQHRSLLHISTHGFYYNDEKANNLKPHLRQMLIGDDRPSYAEDRSLLRSGLCFAGANQALLGKSQPAEWQSDGILNALEIAQTDLRGLDLVVLSACQTALGDVAQGEGVFGLQRGFKKAGAKSILMSLWNVDDLTTQLMMVQFYNNYLAGASKWDSLRKAQQYVRDYKDENGNKLFEEPHYWAGFILLDALD